VAFSTFVVRPEESLVDIGPDGISLTACAATGPPIPTYPCFLVQRLANMWYAIVPLISFRPNSTTCLMVGSSRPVVDVARANRSAPHTFDCNGASMGVGRK